MWRTREVAILAAVVVLGCTARESAQAVPCEAVIGKWTWFTQGVVTFNADGTLVHEPGNDGTWECTDATRGAVTLRWREGGYVNRMAISQDGAVLSSTDPSQSFVNGRRISGAEGNPAGNDRPAAASGALVLATEPQGARSIGKNLPELMERATEAAHAWRADAVPVSLEFEYLDPPNPKLKGPQVRLSFYSPSDGAGQMITITPAGSSTFNFNQRVNWGTLPILPAFVDLPTAARTAISNGVRTPIDRASLRVWSPGRAPPVLAWMINDKTVNGSTGEIIDFDVTGYIESYNAQWEHAAKGLRALLRAGRGSSAGGGDIPIGSDGGSSSSAQPYDDGSAARAEYERNAAEARAYWQLSTEDYNRIKGGDCNMTDSANGHC